MMKDMRPVITFNRGGIRSINIIHDVHFGFPFLEQYTFFDPSIVDQPSGAEVLI